MKRETTQRKRKSAAERRQEVRRTRIIIAGIAILVLVTGGLLVSRLIFPASREAAGTGRSGDMMLADIGNPTKQIAMPELNVQLLTPNEYSRPGTPTDKITGVVVHYTANPGSSAQNNRDYFENLRETRATKASSNFVIGLEGEIIQCIPTAEVAYASNSRNNDTVSIECCHPDESGQFNEATYESLVELVAFLCGKFDLNMDEVIRHYDVTGKICPKYFVENEDAWLQFKQDVAAYIAENGE